MSDSLRLIRFTPRAGVPRTVHLVPPPARTGQPVTIGDYVRVLTALCGQQFAPGEAEMLSHASEDLCRRCAAAAAQPPSTGEQ
ncbi:hypothetical protein [Amycolatopsis cihanbeyliensis]|uniref:Uncharacterized protein n=1 Tax=Amycolatopsis cihanbeyliensis TaxID=1128664 RepID=A0A542CV07_AMYCI|nr:hypothetical protein [Amycolatopsis cihanbeyliensis]TQI94655.1 hypothetical protein FB471_6827 [Amycolatopsis cihanbeyliensis]